MSRITHLWTITATLSATAVVALVACSATSDQIRKVGPPPADALRLYPPAKSVYLRAGFDADPGHLIGSFIPDGLSSDDIDENQGVRSTCSKFITTKVVGGGPGTNKVTQTLNASRNIKAGLGVKPFGQIGGGSDDATGIQVEYTVTEKLVSVVDEDGLEACCDNAPDQCAKLAVGEFWRGSGVVLEFAGSEKTVKASAQYKIASGTFDFKDGWGWKRSTEWTDTFFAFRTQAVWVPGGGLCARPWETRLPETPTGTFHIGVSPPAATETKARELALRDAQANVIKYLGTEIAETYESQSNAIDGLLADETIVIAGAKGIAAKVKDRCWRPLEVQPGPDGLVVAKVLAFYPRATTNDDRIAALRAMQAEAERTKKPALVRSIKGVIATLERP